MKQDIIIQEKFRISEIINKLFVLTDNRQWDELQSSVFADRVHFDMTSMGADKAEMLAADKICRMWEEGFAGLDAVHHLAGNYLIDVEDNNARATAYSVATHYKSAAKKGKTRTFTGSYMLHLIKIQTGWRIDGFKYMLKFSEGNLTLE